MTAMRWLRNMLMAACRARYVHGDQVDQPLVKDWSYSSFHRYVREGVYPHDWMGL